MILSCLPVSYFPSMLRGERSIEGFAAEARGLGLESIDLSVLLLGGRSPRQLAALRRAVKAEGLFVNMVTSYQDFTHPDAAERQRQAGLAGRAIEAAAGLGARMIRLTAGQAHPGLLREQGLARAVQGLLEAAARAEAAGVRAVFENHSRPGVWECFDFCYPTDIFMDIVRATEGSSLGVNFDTANSLAYGDEPLPVLRAVRPRLACIHAADTRERGSFAPTVIGQGAVPFRQLFAYLRESGYDGPVSIEEASGTGPEGLRRAVQHVRRAWQEEVDS
jgi:sugar phosphate isomerase/epimerase